MKKSKFVFVILNYITENDTIQCVESIFQNCKENAFEIIIVDNASPNKSGESLQKKYNNNKLVNVIISEKNLGFANGNNLGFKYAKEKLDADFIILCNSDTEILQNDFCERIMKKYDETNFAVLGPKELLKDSTYYPLTINLPTIKQVKNSILRYRLNYYSGIASYLLKIREKLRGSKNKDKINNYDVNKEYKNIILHGAFLVFSKVYINKFDGLDPRTYFYEEEIMLFIRLIQNDMTNIYDPTIEIFHKHKSATNAVNKNRIRKKEKFVAKNEIQSLKIVLKELRKLKEKNLNR